MKCVADAFHCRPRQCCGVPCGQPGALSQWTLGSATRPQSLGGSHCDCHWHTPCFPFVPPLHVFSGPNPRPSPRGPTNPGGILEWKIGRKFCVSTLRKAGLEFGGGLGWRMDFVKGNAQKNLAFGQTNPLGLKGRLAAPNAACRARKGVMEG